MHALKAGGGASKADVDATIEALKALKVEAGAAARWLQQALGAAGGAAREDLRQAIFFSGSGSIRQLALPAARCLRGNPSRCGAGLGQRSSGLGGSRCRWPAERQPQDKGAEVFVLGERPSARRRHRPRSGFAPPSSNLLVIAAAAAAGASYRRCPLS